MLAAATTAVCAAENWPAWRGADGTGVSHENHAPSKWSKTENVAWRVALPERGNSTPVVWGDRIFLSQAIDKEKWRGLLCLDRASGKLLWKAGLTHDAAEPTHPTNPYASASPVTDGARVIAWFGSAGLAAWDFQGKQLWRRDLGIQKHTWGYGTSPVLSGNRIFLNFGPGERSFLIALDKTTGKTLWQVDYPAGEGKKFANWDPRDMYGSWTTPLLLTENARQQLVVSRPGRVEAYDPETGKLLWWCSGMGDLVYPSPVPGRTAKGETVIVAMGGFGGPSLAVKAGGSGDVTATHRLWRLEKSRQMIGSAVIVDGRVYLVDNGGIAECLDLETGTVIWTERLRGTGEDRGVWSSLVLNNGRLYVMNKSAETFVFKTGPVFEPLGVNLLAEPSNSSVVISAGQIFLRTHEALWKIAKE